MSRQTINYLVVQLEELGYIERRAPDDSDRRLVYLTARGRQVGEVILACLRRVEAEWGAEVGHARFNTFTEPLRQLSGTDTEAESTRSERQQG